MIPVRPSNAVLAMGPVPSRDTNLKLQILTIRPRSTGHLKDSCTSPCTNLTEMHACQTTSAWTPCYRDITQPYLNQTLPETTHSHEWTHNPGVHLCCLDMAITISVHLVHQDGQSMLCFLRRQVVKLAGILGTSWGHRKMVNGLGIYLEAQENGQWS